METLLRPVIISTSCRPAATASSTTYWMAGLSTTGSISLGELFVAGRNRVPRPAAGITALRTLVIRVSSRAAAGAEIDLLPPEQPADVRSVANHDEQCDSGHDSDFPSVVTQDRYSHGKQNRAQQ